MNNWTRTLPMVIPQPASASTRRWLSARQSVILGLVLLAVTAFAGGWYALGFAAVLPLLYVLPCMAMMGFCMRGMGRKDSTGQS